MNDSSIYYEQNMNISTPIIGVLILFCPTSAFCIARSVDCPSLQGFPSALYVLGTLTPLLFAAAELGALQGNRDGVGFDGADIAL